MFDLISRENKIFNVLQEFNNENLHFVLVGGYAVSAYKHRFSIDVDIVIKEGDKEKFEKVLQRKNFKKVIVKELDHVYAPEFIRYETDEKPAASVDILIDGIGSRTTCASFSLEQLEKFATRKIIIGTEKEVEALVPSKEALIALKIHSGRLTDFRDIVALCKNIDLQVIKKFLTVGNKAVITQNIQKLLSLLDEKRFIDGFKGVFQEKKYNVDFGEVRKLKNLIER